MPEKEVSEELLNRLLEEAERTPTMGNLQLYSVVVTRSEEGRRRWRQPTSTSRWCTEPLSSSPSVPIIAAQPSGQRTAREPWAMTTSSLS